MPFNSKLNKLKKRISNKFQKLITKSKILDTTTIKKCLKRMIKVKEKVKKLKVNNKNKCQRLSIILIRVSIRKIKTIKSLRLKPLSQLKSNNQNLLNRKMMVGFKCQLSPRTIERDESI